jgi:hypothetical protein
MMKMSSIQISNKFKNLSILLLAKEEHKKKFNEIIEYKEYQYIPYYDYIWFNRSLKENIEWIKRNQIGFYIKLRVIIGTKFEKYITERKITIPKLDDITEYNCETDCPVCMETIGDNTNGCMEGDNCNHTICSNCRDIIVSNTNKCPICRLKLDDNITDDDTETDTDESEDEDFNGNNRQPTDDLFNGRRWYNTEINQIRYWNNNISGLVDDLNGLSGWSSYNPILRAMETFVIRQNSWNGDNYIEGCCNICGIQKTIEVNEWMMRRRDNNPNITQNGYIWNGDWGDAFDNGDDRQECYECNYRYIQMSDAFYVREET